MGPSKFIAPLKKPSSQSSFSSALSSSSSLGSGNQDVKVAEVQPEQNKSANCSGFKAPNQSKANAIEALEQGATSADAKNSKLLKRSDEPPKKKMKIDSAPIPHNAMDCSDNNMSDNKENICPKSKKSEKAAPAKPCVSRTDEEYERIFAAVLGSDIPKGISSKDDTTNGKSNDLDHSKDMFEFSQSDLDDSEGEQTESTSKKLPVKGGDGTSDNQNSTGSVHDTKHVDQIISEKASLDNTSSCIITSVLDKKAEGTKELETNSETNSSQEDLISDNYVDCKSQIEDSQESSVIHFANLGTSTPLVEKRTHELNLDVSVTPQRSNCQKVLGLSQEQNRSPAPSATKNKTTLASQQSQIEDSQESSVIHFANLGTSTPLVEKRTHELNLDASVTPQRSNCQKVLGLSQEQNRSPAPSATKIKTTPASQQSQVLEPVISSLQLSARSKTPVSQSLLKVPSPTCTQKQQSLSQTPHSSQGLITPTSTPSRKLAIISKNSELLSQTPISAPNTPSGSQQIISQDICLTPPPSEKTAKERLLWLQRKRLTGLWVQCDERECQKWRYLQDCHDPTTLPDKWFCRMHPDEEFNSCDAPERRLSLRAEEDMIFNQYSPGSLVWAKLSGYPWWPAMVEDDPDLEQFYWLNEFSDIPTWYHVVFFDDEDKSLSRAWVQVERLKDYQEEPLDNEVAGLGYKKRVKAADKLARQAKLLSCEQRLAQYSFASRFKGPIGGFPTRKYTGPLGYREPATK